MKDGYYKDESQNEVYVQGGVYHRLDGPAVIKEDGTGEYWLKGSHYKTKKKFKTALKKLKKGKLGFTGVTFVETLGKRYWVDGELHREDGPAWIWPDGTFEWYKKGVLHNDFGPAVIDIDGTFEYWVDGNEVSLEDIQRKIYLMYKSTPRMVIKKDGTKIWKLPGGTTHREDGPAVIYTDGAEEWYQKGYNHRLDGPACTWPDGTEYWYKNDQWHREGGPARTMPVGSSKDLEYWNSGKVHRIDGPAIIKASGDKYWYIDGKMHNENGPAVKRTDGSKEYWLNGNELKDKKAYIRELNLIKEQRLQYQEDWYRRWKLTGF